MIQKNIKYSILILVVFIGFIILIISSTKKSFNIPTQIILNKDQTNNTTTSINLDTEPELPFGQLTRADRIKHIEWSYAHNKPYPQESLTKDGHKDIVVTYYQPGWIEDGISKEEARGGVLVFRIVNNKPILIWENNDNMGGLHALAGLEDVTGDNNNELIVFWQSGKYETLFIYKIENNVFKLISPEAQFGLKYGSSSYSAIFNAGDSEIEFADLDKDNIPEIWFPTTMTKDFTFNEENPHYAAYKWDGQKYFLWKEQKEPFGPNLRNQ